MKVLLVGGRLDGKLKDIVDPERTPYFEAICHEPIALATEWRPDEPPSAVSVTFERLNYQRTSWRVTDEHGQSSIRYVYALAGSPAQLFDRLLEHYGPTKDARIKALEEEVRDLRATLREANMMIGNHHRQRLGL